ncbi:MAG: hypothetical protein ACFE0O_07955 [Opitutales bacterium]
MIFDDGPNHPRYFRRDGLTDEQGRFIARAKARISVGITVEKDGFYKFGFPNAQPLDYGMKELPEVFEQIFRIRRIIKPIPLFARRTNWNAPGEEAYRLPQTDTWIGFDFKAIDWVAPYGRGKTADIQFRYTRTFHEIYVSPYNPSTVEEQRVRLADKHRRLNRPFNEAIFREQAGVWSGTLEIGFVRPGDGWVKVDEAFNPHSKLQMPHKAPVDGYRDDSWSRYIHSRESMNEISTSNPTYGYFLRTRTELDAAGNVESAHYAKIVGEIGFYPTGKVWMTYYFNPTPNDRNLELDPQKNLIRSNNRYNPVQNLLP